MKLRKLIAWADSLSFVLYPFLFAACVFEMVTEQRIRVPMVLALMFMGFFLSINAFESTKNYRKWKRRAMNVRRTLLIMTGLLWIPLVYLISQRIGDVDLSKSVMTSAIVSFVFMMWLAYLAKTAEDGQDRYYRILQRKVREEMNPFQGNEHDAKLFHTGTNGPNTNLVEKIARAANRVNGRIFSVANPGGHGHVTAYMHDSGVSAVDIDNCDQGFVTTYGRYVERREAKQIAIKACQLRPDAYDLGELYSEDMWSPDYFI